MSRFYIIFIKTRLCKLLGTDEGLLKFVKFRYVLKKHNELKLLMPTP